MRLAADGRLLRAAERHGPPQLEAVTAGRSGRRTPLDFDTGVPAWREPLGIEDAIVVFDVGGRRPSRPSVASRRRPEQSDLLVAGRIGRGRRRLPALQQRRVRQAQDSGEPGASVRRAHRRLPGAGGPRRGRATMGSAAWSPDGSTLAYATSRVPSIGEPPFCLGGRTTMKTVSLARANQARCIGGERPVLGSHVVARGRTDRLRWRRWQRWRGWRLCRQRRWSRLAKVAVGYNRDGRRTADGSCNRSSDASSASHPPTCR